MALFKYPQFMSLTEDGNFDILREPGSDSPDGGVYRCVSCGHEIGIARGQRLPPQNHHHHALGLAPIRWRLIAAAGR
jgi:hypothetical protein